MSSLPEPAPSKPSTLSSQDEEKSELAGLNLKVLHTWKDRENEEIEVILKQTTTLTEFRKLLAEREDDFLDVRIGKTTLSIPDTIIFDQIKNKANPPKVIAVHGEYTCSFSPLEDIGIDLKQHKPQILVVDRGSQAERFGVRPGWIETAVNGKSCTNASVDRMINQAKKKKRKPYTITFDTTWEPELGTATEADHSSSDEQSEELILECSEGHEMRLLRIGKEADESGHLIHFCDGCESKLEEGGGESVWRCTFCDLDLCLVCAQQDCTEKNKETLSPIQE